LEIQEHITLKNETGLDDNVDISRAWEGVGQSIKTSGINSVGNFEKLY